MATKSKSKKNMSEEVRKYLRGLSDPTSASYPNFLRATKEEGCSASLFYVVRRDACVPVSKEKAKARKTKFVSRSLKLVRHFTSLKEEGVDISKLSYAEYRKMGSAIDISGPLYYANRVKFLGGKPSKKASKVKSGSGPKAPKRRKYTLYQTIYSRSCEELRKMDSVQVLREFVQELRESGSKLDAIELSNPNVFEVREFN